MGFITQKREIDLVSIISIAVVAVILSLFSSWLYYSDKIDTMKTSNDLKYKIFKEQISYLQEKNNKLEEKLKKVTDALKPDEIIPEETEE